MRGRVGEYYRRSRRRERALAKFIKKAAFYARRLSRGGLKEKVRLWEGKRTNDNSKKVQFLSTIRKTFSSEST